MKSTLNGKLNDYKNLRTIPAIFGMFFFVSTLYQFGGIAEVHITWFDYTLTTLHAMGFSLMVYVLAFASSETRRWVSYTDGEKVVIASGPTVLIGHQYIDPLYDLVHSADPLTAMIAAGIVLFAFWTATQ